MPKIAVFNKATIPLGVELDSLIAAMQLYINQLQCSALCTAAG